MAFQKYQSEQVQQIAPGFVEAYSNAGKAIGGGLQALGSGIAGGITGKAKMDQEKASLEGAVKPYVQSEVNNVETSIKNGFLQRSAEGKISVVPGQESYLDTNKISRAIDVYNRTDGGKKELKTAELTGLMSTIQSYDALDKMGAERQKVARDAKIGELEYQSKLLSNAAALSQGIAVFANEKRSIASAMAMQGDTAGAQSLIAESRALSEKSQAVLMDAYGSTGINVQAFMPKPVTPPPARPAAVAVGSGASTLYTVNAPAGTAAPAGMDVSRFNSAIGAVPTTKAPSLEAPAATIATAPIAAPVDYGNRVDGTKKGTGFLGEIKMADGRVATEVSVGVNINGKDVEIPTLVPTLSAEQKSFIAGGGDPRTRPDIIRAATDHASKRIADGKSPFNEPAKASAATGRNLMLGTMPKVETAQAAPAVGAPVKPVTVGKPEYVVQAEAEIKSLQTQKEIYTDQFKRARVNRAMVGLNADEVKAYDKQANDANAQAIKIDDSITEKMKALTAEQTRVETGAIATTKLGMEQAKTMDDRLPDFGQGYMAAGRAKAFTLYPEDPGRALTDLRIAGIKGESKEITETIGAIGSFMEGTMSIESAIDARLEEGKGYFDRFTLTSDDYENIAKGNVSEKILLASMRKVIVSGGNFSDADRTFVLEAIASINSVDPTKRNEYFKSLNKVMAGMVFKMYDGKLKSMGVERHLELLSPEDRATAVSDTEKAFKSRFGLDDTNAASGARTELSALIKEAKGNKSFISDRKQAESAVATFIDKAKQERAIAEAAKEPKK